MNICVISDRYPNKYNDADFVFVKKLVDEFARQGNHCAVITPFSILHYKGFLKSFNDYSIGEGSVKEFRPNYLSAGTHKFFGISLTHILHQKAINKAFRMMERFGFKPDVIYCHFWGSGLLGYQYATKHNLPLFVASGESEIDINNSDGHLEDFCNYVKGVICVSSKNRDESVKFKLTIPEKCLVAPNAVNDSVFHKMDKNECRQKLGLPLDKYIVVFVGWFIDRKGPMRVATAIEGMESNDVYSMFIGSGEQTPECKNILFRGRVDNPDLPVYLNAADVFVLPTLQEGCCNAVVEALSCGIPVISSNLPFNWDVLDGSNSIMIDPGNIQEIRQAIEDLKNNIDKRTSLAKGAERKAAELTIKRRADKIVNFMKQ